MNKSDRESLNDFLYPSYNELQRLNPYQFSEIGGIARELVLLLGDLASNLLFIRGGISIAEASIELLQGQVENATISLLEGGLLIGIKLAWNSLGPNLADGFIQKG